MAGSVYESSRMKCSDPSKITLFMATSRFTDDSVMTLAVARWLTDSRDKSAASLVEAMQKLGRKYPNAGYGPAFARWLAADNPKPYGSWGNGAAMRVSYIAYHFDTLEKVEEEAKNSAMCTHNHIEGLKAAVATAGLIYLALHGERKKDLKKYLTKSLNTPCISRCGRTGRRRSLMLRRRGPCRLRSAALWKARIGKAASAMCSA